MKKKSTPEFQAFDNMMGKILSVPHSEIKRKLDAEKAEKKARKKRAKKSAEERNRAGSSQDRA
jgi:hypothetical protein